MQPEDRTGIVVHLPTPEKRTDVVVRLPVRNHQQLAPQPQYCQPAGQGAITPADVRTTIFGVLEESRGKR